MMTYPKKVLVEEQGLRDGLQGEKTIVPTEIKLKLINAIVDAGVKFSSLAISFSNYFPVETEFVITEFEINPFIFTPNGTFIAIDGFARFQKRQEQPADLAIADPETIIPFFEPDGIAVVGASTTDSSKMGNLILNNLINIQRDDVYCVNIKGGFIEIAGKNRGNFFVPVQSYVEQKRFAGHFGGGRNVHP